MSFPYSAIALAWLTLGGAAADAPPPLNANSHVVFLHKGHWRDADGAPEVVNALQTALAQRGYIVRQSDDYRDEVGGVGVDYFQDADKPIAQDIADVVNHLIYSDVAALKPRLQNVKAHEGYIGVWLYDQKNQAATSIGK